MLATLGGALALLLGLAVLLLPLLAPELSRPRDAVWGAVVLLLGLVLVTSADRLTGAPMLGVLCGGLLIGRLAVEVGQGRWFRLSPEERQLLWSAERWRTVLDQLGASVAKLVTIASGSGAVVGGWIAARRAPRGSGKRWVRPEDAASPAPPPAPEPPATTVIPSLDAIDPLLDAAADEPGQRPSPEPQQEASGEAG
ncbi:MAG: Ycf66 family protein [Cyanobacteriota bacterium]